MSENRNSSGSEVMVIGDPQAMSGENSDYWKERNANIARNKAMMAELRESYGQLFEDIQAGGSSSKLAKGKGKGSRNLVNKQVSRLEIQDNDLYSCFIANR